MDVKILHAQGDEVAIRFTRAARAGRMVLSNGPFLEVSLDGVGPGGELKGKGSWLLKIRVQCAGGIDVDRIQVLVNGRPDPALNWTRGSGSAGFSTGADTTRFEREVPLNLSRDAHLIVIATGEQSKLGPYHGNYGAQPPTALSNPIFVDVDGGEASLLIMIRWAFPCQSPRGPRMRQRGKIDEL